jgi:formate-dependent nitrite reductase membrane component NrfD
MPQHFVSPPQWEWYIVWYFFLGGLAGGAYALGAVARLAGGRRDEGLARLAFLLSFPAVVICPLLLTLDLGRPFRFWHMLIDSRTLGLNFKYWSPMSLGAWVLLLFSVFAAVSFAETVARDWQLQAGWATRLVRTLSGGFGRLFVAVGAVLGLFLAGYTGVLLSVSNQPIWSDTWALGGLFLASGLSVAAAALGLLGFWRSDVSASEDKLSRADRYFIVLELALLVVFFVTLGASAARLVEGRLLLLWVLVLAGTLVPLVIHFRPAPRRPGPAIVAFSLVLLGGLALRVVVIFSAQL